MNETGASSGGLCSNLGGNSTIRSWRRDEDILIWYPSKTGNLGLSEAWKAVRHRGTSFLWTKWIWQPIQSPKHSLCAWQAFHDKLPTLSRLQSKGLIQNSVCPLCASDREDVDHLLLGCSYSRFMWSLLFRDLLIRTSLPHNLAAFPPWLDSHMADPRHKSILLCNIKASIRESTVSKIFPASKTPENQKIADSFGLQLKQKVPSIITIHWSPPHEGWFKLNTDGSLADDRGGYGALIRNEHAEFVIGLAGRLDLPSINLLELKAIEKGVDLGLSINLTKLWIESDSTTAIAWLLGKGCIPWTAFRSLRHLHQSLDKMDCWKATHIHCEGNSPADLLAAFQSARGETFFSPGQIWPELQDMLKEDKSMKGYQRIT
ncbi:hypothetical protein QJS04_geneDACA008217 [Acorus gramineus]|uniref:Uncharacterized protein n=1 Tax=Acorus gramineus TaxID=55184 RepID=A0AAV9AWR1_ACOGR|nr:hypothetical protein QJS04_geneDACA008217 [Acorus gramineus]